MFDTRKVRGWAKLVARNEALRDAELKKGSRKMSVRDYDFYRGWVDAGRTILLSELITEVPGKPQDQLKLMMERYITDAHEELAREEKKGLGTTKASA